METSQLILLILTKYHTLISTTKVIARKTIIPRTSKSLTNKFGISLDFPLKFQKIIWSCCMVFWRKPSSVTIKKTWTISRKQRAFRLCKIHFSVCRQWLSHNCFAFHVVSWTSILLYRLAADLPCFYEFRYRLPKILHFRGWRVNNRFMN